MNMRIRNYERGTMDDGVIFERFDFEVNGKHYHASGVDWRGADVTTGGSVRAIHEVLIFEGHPVESGPSNWTEVYARRGTMDTLRIAWEFVNRD